MNKLIFVLISLLTFSCNRKSGDKEIPVIDSLVIVSERVDSTNIKTDMHYFWTAELDQDEGLVVKRTYPVPADSLSVDAMIAKINETYPEIRLRYNRVSNDSIFLKINSASWLTQQMGSSGAEAYLAEVTFNLTELKEINYVDIRFKAGDHAEPGTYSRTDFVHETIKHVEKNSN